MKGVLKKYQIFCSNSFKTIERIGGIQFKQPCEEAKVTKLDENDKELLLELKNSKRKDPMSEGLFSKYHDINTTLN